MKVLITAGATREAIDGVRFITNFSTGQTGRQLAESFLKCRHDVVYLCGEGAKRPRPLCDVHVFKDFADIDAQLKDLLKTHRFDLIIHSAAIGDYSVDWIEVGGEKVSDFKNVGKFKSDEDMVLGLRKNHKIIDCLRDYAGYEVVIAAFKLTNTAILEERQQAIQTISERSGADWVIHNDLSEVRKADRHHLNIYHAGELREECTSVDELAEFFLRRFGGFYESNV
jgi:phosphopantothenoylcysteine decarboxylase/phosphopantothenate--cysteine ligase